MAYDPKKAAEKQIRRAQEATQDYIDGVMKPKRNPMQAAKAKKSKLKSNFNAAIDNGDWERGLDSISQDEWSRLASTKGGARYSGGVEAARGDIEQFHEEMSQVSARVEAIVDAMPDDTPEQRLAKMRANAVERGKHKRTKRRR